MAETGRPHQEHEKGATALKAPASARLGGVDGAAPAAFHPSLTVRALSYAHLHALNLRLLVWPRRLCAEWGGSPEAALVDGP